IDLEAAPLVDDRLPRALGEARKETAEHDAVRAGGEGLGDVAGIPYTPVRDQGHSALGHALASLVDRGNLRNADAGDDAGGADRVVNDGVVRDEAVRRAIDLDVVNGDDEVGPPTSELLHHLKLAQMPLAVAHIETRPVARPAALVARPPQAPRGR